MIRLTVATLLVMTSCAAIGNTDTSQVTPASDVRLEAVAEAAVTTTVPAPTTTRRATTSLAPTTTTTTTTTTEPPRRRIVIHGTGDVNVDPDYIAAFRSHGYGHAWSGLGGLFAGDDLTVINLECPISDLGSPADKTFTFRCDPAALPSMVEAGIEVANLGNNHSRDFGVDAMLDSIERLGAAGIAAVGVGENAAAAHQPALLDIGGWRIAVLGFGGVVPSPSWIAGADHPGMADGDTIDSMVAAVAAAAEVADLVVVSIHWGVELDLVPRPEDVERARAMIAAGADVIFGHHAHRLQPLEVVDGKPVAWGLGNFVWPRLSPQGSITAVAEVVVEPDGTMHSCLVPVVIESDGHPVLVEEYQGPCAP